ncbi:MAG: dTDP-4-dehydrorhamnose reductase [Lachnospiraceae bacterium]|nr:dTDP-4-dehydrorhamnose reductase [Lachnospiraceae bacterium]
MRIMVTGAAGQLGSDVVEELTGRGHEVLPVDIAEMDITNPEETMRVITEAAPEAVIHCAAYTAVDAAESNEDLCRAINAGGTENVARACAAAGCRMMYISTDYVFDGEGTRPWEPDDARHPLSVYGATKCEGEMAVERLVEKFFIVRIAWIFGVRGKNFVKTMLRLGAEKEEISVVADQIGSPTYTRDLARLFADMIVTEHYGRYHATNEGFCSWYDFTCEIMRRANLPARIKPVTSDQYPTAAKRPHNSRMSKEKLTANGFDRLPPWQDALGRFLEELEG